MAASAAVGSDTLHWFPRDAAKLHISRQIPGVIGRRSCGQRAPQNTKMAPNSGNIQNKRYNNIALQSLTLIRLRSVYSTN